jgi:adenine-specific DNA-methyltransferase
MAKLRTAGRLVPYEDGRTLRYLLKLSDSPVSQLTNLWADTSAPSDKVYVVQTSTKIVERCLHMTTRPGDLVVDPTCGSGTTAYAAEKWGRRWITPDVSRVPLALARQRLLTSTYRWYRLKDEKRGPVAGFVYEYKENERGLQVGGVVRRRTRGSIANDQQAEEVTLQDKPETTAGITRVTGPFAFEASIPTPVEAAAEGQDEVAPAGDAGASFTDRMLEVLRRSPILRLEGNRQVKLENVRPPAKTLSLSAEALQGNGDKKPVALVFGPENGAVSQKLVFEAAGEARLKGYQHLYVVGFAIQPNAREFVEKCDAVAGVPAT